MNGKQNEKELAQNEQVFNLQSAIKLCVLFVFTVAETNAEYLLQWREVKYDHNSAGNLARTYKHNFGNLFTERK